MDCVDLKFVITSTSTSSRLVLVEMKFMKLISIAFQFN